MFMSLLMVDTLVTQEFCAANNLLKDLPSEMGNLTEKKLQILRLENNKFTDRKIKQILEKSVKLVKELTTHLRSRGEGGGGGGIVLWRGHLIH